jgi:hypothetical protein
MIPVIHETGCPRGQKIEQTGKDTFRDRSSKRRQLRLFLSEQPFDQAPLRIVEVTVKSPAIMLDIELRNEDTLVHQAPAIQFCPCGDEPFANVV